MVAFVREDEDKEHYEASLVSLYRAWARHIDICHGVVEGNTGPRMVAIVSGSETDASYWASQFKSSRRDLFRRDGDVEIFSVPEHQSLGNFLGTLNAWNLLRKHLHSRLTDSPTVALLTMVFGQGKRLSPFTQAMGNRKPALVTPLFSTVADRYLSTAEVSSLYTNEWITFLQLRGFHGLLVKWGDEAIIPSADWDSFPLDLSKSDAVRFAWRTTPTETLASEKDWIVGDLHTYRMTAQLSRQSLSSLIASMEQYAATDPFVGVNLGSVAVTPDFLDCAGIAFDDCLLRPSGPIDWDPYLWVALLTESETEWLALVDRERQSERKGLQKLLVSLPDFYQRAQKLRSLLEARTGRQIAITILDFGEAFWTDFGLQKTLRECLDALTTDSPRGYAYRDLFRIPHTRDAHGNIIINSSIPMDAEIVDSVIVDSTIQDHRSVIRRGVVIGCRHGSVQMPHGGASLFSAVRTLVFHGENALAYRVIADATALHNGGRATTLFLSNGSVPIETREEITDYTSDNYTKRILGNSMSFEEAGVQMAKRDGAQIDKDWFAAWKELPLQTDCTEPQDSRLST